VTTQGSAGDTEGIAARGARDGLTVRPATADDAAALAALSTELGYPAEEAQIARRLEVLLASDDDVVIVAPAGAAVGAQTMTVTAERVAGAPTPRRDSELLGFVHAAEKRLLVSEPFVELEGLIVVAAARRHGAAAALVAAVERWALARGIGELRVRARLERDEADRFYRGRGFELEKRQRVFSKRLRSASG
jgi:GNAT superfamily N-acetyltransferase